MIWTQTKFITPYQAVFALRIAEKKFLMSLMEKIIRDQKINNIKIY